MDTEQRNHNDTSLKKNNYEINSSNSSINTGSKNPSFNINNDIFVSRLIQAVRQHPCLFDPNHEHYGNKQASGQFRAAVWKNLCTELDFKGL